MKTVKTQVHASWKMFARRLMCQMHLKYVYRLMRFLQCAILEIDDLSKIDDEGEEVAAVCEPVLKCSETMQCLDTHHHFPSEIFNIPE
jgi:hypothetical protein